MLIKNKSWFVNIQFQHEKRRQQYDKYKDDLKKATSGSVEEEDHAESLKALQENMILSKSELK